MIVKYYIHITIPAVHVSFLMEKTMGSLIFVLMRDKKGRACWSSCWRKGETVAQIVAFVRDQAKKQSCTYGAMWEIPFKPEPQAALEDLHASYGTEFRKECLLMFAKAFAAGSTGKPTLWSEEELNTHRFASLNENARQLFETIHAFGVLKGAEWAQTQ